ncbi:MAG: desulfoferrodoxin family protein [Spirochaetia bacterium]|nr:desulfoferrodoxin family protein [Spirochaetia bacterium]
MPKINRYVDISTVDREAKKDYIDRHSPFIHCTNKAVKGTKLPVTVKVGNEFMHPDDPDHFIESVKLYNGDSILGEARFLSGTLGGGGSKSQAEVTFHVVPTTEKLVLTAVAYCTKHGLWESDPVEIPVT